MNFLKKTIGTAVFLGFLLILTNCHTGTDPQPETYTVGGIVTGLTGTMTLTLNNSENKNITANGAYVFETELEDGESYSVTCSVEPDGQQVTVTNGTGTISGGNIGNANIECVDLISLTFTVSVQVSGLTASGFRISLNGIGENITENGLHTFDQELAQGDSYVVAIVSQPTDQYAVVTNGRGLIDGENVEDITISCQTPVSITALTDLSTLGSEEDKVFTTDTNIVLDSFDQINLSTGTVLVLESGTDIIAGDYTEVTLAADSQIIAEDSGNEIITGTESQITLDSGAQIIMGDDSGITSDTGSTITISEDSHIEMGDNSGITVGTDSTVTIEADSYIEMGQNSDIVIGQNGTLDVQDNSVIQIGNGGELNIASYASLTAAPGTTFRFGNSSGFVIEDYAEFSLVGTETAPITLTAQQATPGYWYGLSVGGCPDADNALDWVIIEYAGGNPSAPYNSSALSLQGDSDSAPARLSLSNTTIRYSLEKGFDFNEFIDLLAFGNITVTENEGYAGDLYPNHIRFFETGNDFSGNNEDYIFLYCYGQSIEDSQTWPNMNAAYRFGSGDLNILTALTLSPGVTVQAEADRWIKVGTSGSLNAAGTSDAPITFTSASGASGYWYGLDFNESASAGNILDYCVVEYGGKHSGYTGNINIRAGAELARLANTTMENSLQYGLYLVDDSSITDFHDNTITGNAEGAVFTYPNLVQYLDETSAYTGNDNEVIYLYCYGKSVDDDQTWPDLSVPYQFGTSDLTINADLTLNPGVTIEAQEDRWIKIGTSGSLNAAGTSAAPITFTSRTGASGYWYGLDFSESASASNILDYCVVEYGGKNSGYTGNINIRAGAALARLANTTIRNSNQNGLYFIDSSIADFHDNIITDNGECPVFTEPNLIQYLDDTTVYTGNSDDFIHLYCYNNDVKEEQNWPDTGVEYRIFSADLSVKAPLSISPGVSLIFETGRGLVVTTGSLNADGTSENPIIFTGETAAPGSWKGLAFYGSVSLDNKLDFCQIQYGGSETSGYFQTAGLTLKDYTVATNLTLTNSVISNNNGYGVDAEITNVNVNGTATSSYADKAAFLTDLESSGNSFSNNSTAEVNLR
ncbi:MAG: hypothetical protein JXR86_02640 [Spirochaetales bacterium]|nr:hypothetical protein [Spirochaetales bacterium]